MTVLLKGLIFSLTLISSGGLVVGGYFLTNHQKSSEGETKNSPARVEPEDSSERKEPDRSQSSSDQAELSSPDNTKSTSPLGSANIEKTT